MKKRCRGRWQIQGRMIRDNSATIDVTNQVNGQQVLHKTARFCYCQGLFHSATNVKCRNALPVEYKMRGARVSISCVPNNN